MYLFFIDDAQQRGCRRHGVNELVAIGGIIIAASAARRLQRTLDRLSEAAGFPEGEVFKWSPGRGDWMKANLIDAPRAEFFREALATARNHEASCVVAMVETNWLPAAKRPPMMDAMTLALERFQNFLNDHEEHGLVIAAKPGGGTDGENQLLEDCLETLRLGTDFVGFGRIATNVVTMPFSHSRLLQVADLVVSSSTALAAGNTQYSAPLVPHIKPMLRTDWRGCVGGFGVKLHPDGCYQNLYHWLWGDPMFGRHELPRPGKPFARSADVYEGAEG